MENDNGAHQSPQLLRGAEEHLAQLLLGRDIDSSGQVAALKLIRKSAVDDDQLSQGVVSRLLDHQLSQVRHVYPVLLQLA